MKNQNEKERERGKRKTRYGIRRMSKRRQWKCRERVNTRQQPDGRRRFSDIIDSCEPLFYFHGECTSNQIFQSRICSSFNL